MGVRESWQEYAKWLRTNVPAAHKNLAPPATDKDLAKVERATGLKLPDDLKELWRCNNGQKVTMISTSLEPGVPTIPTLTFLSTTTAVEVWKQWASMRANEKPKLLASLNKMGKSVFPGTVKPLYTNAGWIPLWSDPTRADYIGVDLDPGGKGTRGQIINFGRDEQEHAVFAPGIAGLLDILLAEVRGGDWRKSKMDYGKKQIAWFGEPDAHFFNALQRRRPQAPPKAKTALDQLRELIDEAEKRARLQQWPEALAVVEQIRGLGTKPGMRTSTVEAAAYEGLGRWQDLERVLAQMTKLFPHLEALFVRRATNLLDNLRDAAAAAKVIRAGLKKHPEDEDLLALKTRAK